MDKLQELYDWIMNRQEDSVSEILKKIESLINEEKQDES